MTISEDKAKAAGRPVAKGDHVYLIDGSGYIFRAFHALPPLTRPSDGLPVGAVHGFCAMLWKLLREAGELSPPTHIAAIFDLSEHTFRNELYADYKAHRPDLPEDLVPQFPLIRDAVTFVLSGVSGLDESDLSNVSFQYGTSLSETNIAASCTAGCTTTVPVPEPTTMALLGSGLLIAGGFARRRRLGK